MAIKDFSTKLNFFTKYVLGITSSNWGKLEVFLDRLKLDIAKDVILGDNPPKYILKALGTLLRLEAMR